MSSEDFKNEAKRYWDACQRACDKIDELKKQASASASLASDFSSEILQLKHQLDNAKLHANQLKAERDEVRTTMQKRNEYYEKLLRSRGLVDSSREVRQASKWDWHPYATPESPPNSTPYEWRGDFDDVKIGDSTEFRFGRVVLEAVRLNSEGFHSSRGHFLVYCVRCDTLITRCTTGPLWCGHNHAEVCTAIDKTHKRYNEGVTHETKAERWTKCTEGCGHAPGGMVGR